MGRVVASSCSLGFARLVHHPLLYSPGQRTPPPPPRNPFPGEPARAHSHSSRAPAAPGAAWSARGCRARRGPWLGIGGICFYIFHLAVRGGWHTQLTPPLVLDPLPPQGAAPTDPGQQHPPTPGMKPTFQRSKPPTPGESTLASQDLLSLPPLKKNDYILCNMYVNRDVYLYLYLSAAFSWTLGRNVLLMLLLRHCLRM